MRTAKEAGSLLLKHILNAPTKLMKAKLRPLLFLRSRPGRGYSGQNYS